MRNPRRSTPRRTRPCRVPSAKRRAPRFLRSEEHTSELQSHLNLVCRLLLEKKKTLLLYCGVLGVQASHTLSSLFFFFNDTATTEIYPLSLHDALPICDHRRI